MATAEPTLTLAAAPPIASPSPPPASSVLPLRRRSPKSTGVEVAFSSERARHMITTQRLTKRVAHGDRESQFRLGYRLAFGASRKAKPDWRRIVTYWRASR